MAAEAKPGATNGYDSAKLTKYIQAVEAVEVEIASDTGTFMADVKAKRKDIKDLLADAKNDGIPLKALRAELKLRRLDRDKEKIVEALEDDDRESLEAIQHALGDFASSPLGAAALKAAH